MRAHLYDSFRNFGLLTNYLLPEAAATGRGAAGAAMRSSKELRQSVLHNCLLSPRSCRETWGGKGRSAHWRWWPARLAATRRCAMRWRTTSCSTRPSWTPARVR